VTFRVLYKLGGRIEAHRLAVEHRAQERGGLVALEPAACVDEEREARRVTLRKTVFAEALNLREDRLGELPVITALQHAFDDAVVVVLQSALAFPRGHRTP
jgi:hypothetical protein